MERDRVTEGPCPWVELISMKDIKKVSSYLGEINARFRAANAVRPAAGGPRITKSNTYTRSAFVGSRWIKVSSRIVLAENDGAASFDA